MILKYPPFDGYYTDYNSTAGIVANRRRMHNSATTAGGYKASEYRNVFIYGDLTNFASFTQGNWIGYAQAIKNAVGSSHVIPFYERLSSTVTDGKVTASTIKSCTCEDLSMHMYYDVYNVLGTSQGVHNGISTRQLAYFRNTRFAPTSNRKFFRDIASATAYYGTTWAYATDYPVTINANTADCGHWLYFLLG